MPGPRYATKADLEKLTREELLCLANRHFWTMRAVLYSRWEAATAAAHKAMEAEIGRSLPAAPAIDQPAAARAEFWNRMDEWEKARKKTERLERIANRRWKELQACGEDSDAG